MPEEVEREGSGGLAPQALAVQKLAELLHTACRAASARTAFAAGPVWPELENEAQKAWSFVVIELFRLFAGVRPADRLALLDAFARAFGTSGFYLTFDPE